MLVSKEQIKEWTEHPVTKALYWLFTRQLNELKQLTVTECLIKGEPQKTQEELILKHTREVEIQTFIDLLQNGSVAFKYWMGDLDNYDKLVEADDEDGDQNSA